MRGMNEDWRFESSFGLECRRSKVSITEEAGHDQLTKEELNDPFFRDAFTDDHYIQVEKPKSKKKKAIRLTPEEVNNLSFFCNNFC